MPTIHLPPLLAKPGSTGGFLALLEVLRRARISGIRRAKIYGTDKPCSNRICSSCGLHRGDISRSPSTCAVKFSSADCHLNSRRRHRATQISSEKSAGPLSKVLAGVSFHSYRYRSMERPPRHSVDRPGPTNRIPAQSASRRRSCIADTAADHNRFLVHVHSDIFDVITHLSCLLGGRVFVLTLIFPLKVTMPFSRQFAYVLLQSFRTRFTIAVTP
jgi:hypothetical protein